jgi:hypothetical protein
MVQLLLSMEATAMEFLEDQSLVEEVAVTDLLQSQFYLLLEVMATEPPLHVIVPDVMVEA